MNGILLVDKEQTWTSSDVVVKLKGILRQRRVGHAGTLDPMATGLLVVFAGRATRAVEFAERDSKRYLASLRLGTVTDTQDVWGTVLEKNSADVGRDELEAALKRFRGAQEQLPPMYSAVKVNGRKLCDVARRGGEVERRPRGIVIHELTLLGRNGEDWLLDIRCSKGTYIRTLCHDIGQALGCGGCMSALRRTEAGGFSVENALTISDIQALADAGELEERLLPVDRLFAGNEMCRVSSEEEKKLRCGSDFPTALPNGDYRVYGASGDFLMLGRAEDGRMRTVKSFFEV
ncbi:MAG: tRNA pseudouridine(55) synthase TruB [Eubacteriales bacterium]|nr:tRNA pseudouridine(55) synthase TruB [Eubacteriales bacterium]